MAAQLFLRLEPQCPVHTPPATQSAHVPLRQMRMHTAMNAIAIRARTMTSMGFMMQHHPSSCLLSLTLVHTRAMHKKPGCREIRHPGFGTQRCRVCYAETADSVFVSSSSVQANLGIGRKSWNRMPASSTTARALQISKIPFAAFQAALMITPMHQAKPHS